MRKLGGYVKKIFRLTALLPVSVILASCFQDGGSQTSMPSNEPTLEVLAGSIGGWGNIDGTAGAARFYEPGGVAIDRSGNIYVADTGNHTVRKISSGGRVSTIAGHPGLQGAADGSEYAALFNYPTGIAVDSAGTIYVADSLNNAIREITSDGDVSTLAGSPQYFGSSDGGGSAARFNYPTGVAVDASGILYVADSNNETIRKITPQGLVTTLAGAPYYSLGCLAVDGIGAAARFCQPWGIAVDVAGNVYVAERMNESIRKVTPDGIVTTVAGNSHVIGSADGSDGAATFFGPQGIAVDSAGIIYVADGGKIRKITATGVVTTLTGAAGVTGSADGDLRNATFTLAAGIAVDNTGTLYVADDSTIRRLGTDGIVTTLAGAAPEWGAADGVRTAARFAPPYSNPAAVTSMMGIAVNQRGIAYVADTGNRTIRKIDTGGTVTTLAGSAGLTGSSGCLLADGTGSAARFCAPTGVAVDQIGTVYVADPGNHSLRKVTSAGLVTTISSGFGAPTAVAVDNSSGTLYVADVGSKTVDRITPDGIVTVLAGSAPPSCNVALEGTNCIGYCPMDDGVGPAAHFCIVLAMAVDRSGILYVLDNGLIREVSSNGSVKSITEPVPATYSGLALAGDGVFYLSKGHTIVRIDSKGERKVLVGSQDSVGIAPGSLPASLSNPSALAIGPQGRLFIVDGAGILLVSGLQPGRVFPHP